MSLGKQISANISETAQLTAMNKKVPWGMLHKFCTVVKNTLCFIATHIVLLAMPTEAQPVF